MITKDKLIKAEWNLRKSRSTEFWKTTRPNWIKAENQFEMRISVIFGWLDSRLPKDFCVWIKTPNCG